MSQLLQAVVVLVLVVTCTFLVLLLVQLRKTAIALEDLARSAAKDLAKVADDVHQIRLQSDEVASLAKDALALPAQLSKIVGGVTRAVPSLFGSSRLQGGLLEILMSGIQMATAFFRRPKAAHNKEEHHE